MQQLASHQVDYPGSVIGLAVLDYMLGHVVAVLVLDKGKSAGVQLSQNRCLGILVAVFQHALDHAASVRMGCQGLHLAVERLDDELDVFGRHPLDRLLDDVVAVLVLDALQHVTIEFLD